MESVKLKINGIYQHYKGQHYQVLDVVRHSETLDKLVLYKALYENPLGPLWVRPLEMFLGSVTVSGQKLRRFELVSDLQD